MASKSNKPYTVRRYEDSEDRYIDAEDFGEIVEFYLDNGMDTEAWNALERGLELHPDNPVINWYKLSMLLDDEEFDRIIKEKDSLMERIYASNDEILHYTSELFVAEALIAEGRSNEGDALIKKVISEEDEHLFDRLMRAGDIYEDYECYSRAIPIFKKALEIEPGDENALESLAHCYEQQDDNKTAAKMIERLLDGDTYNAYWWMHLGRNYMLSDQIDKSLKAFEYAHAIDPDNAVIMTMLAAAHMRAGNNTKAAELFSQADELPKGISFESLASAAACYMQEQEYSKAAELLYKQAFNGKLGREDLINLYECLIKTERFQECMFMLKQLSHRKDLAYHCKMLLGDMHCSHFKDFKKGVTCYLAASKLPEANGQELLNAALAALSAGKSLDALDYCTMAEIRFPDLPDLYVVMACAYYELNDVNEMLKAIKTGLKKGHEKTAELFVGLCPSTLKMLKLQKLLDKDFTLGDDDDKKRR